jgi:APA family basic amino acid/polyamine antiporter
LSTTRSAEPVELRRGLGPFDAILLTIGSIVGTGIFLTGSQIAAAVPHAGIIVLVWILGGLFTLAGALTLAELGAAFPFAGGMYHYLKEAYGPLLGFLYGWLAFLVNMSGGIAAVAVGFGIYFGRMFPFFASEHVLCAVPIGGWHFTLDGAQLAAVVAIILLTAVNHFGLGPGAGANGLVTLIKVLAISGFAIAGLCVMPHATPHWFAPLHDAIPESSGNASSALLKGFIAAMIAVLWAYDGSTGLTASAGELRRPARDLPIGLGLGVLVVVVMYVAMNVMYLRAMPLDEMAASQQIGTDAVTRLLGASAGNLLTIAVVVSSFGCLASTILYSSRIYVPMARDGLFFRAAGYVHPRWRTPVGGLWLQSAWAIVLTLSGRYDQLYTFSIFASLLILLAAGSAVFVLRMRRPDLPRPYRVPGYPFVPFVFLASVTLLTVAALIGSPLESLIGLLLAVLGLPAYFLWRRKSARARIARP